MVGELGNRRSRRSLRTRSMILDAAATVFAEHGYEATSVDLVAAQAGVTKGTIYYQFDSKEAIYTGVVLRYLEGALERLNEAIASHETVVAALDQIVDDQIDDTFMPSRRYLHFQELIRLEDETHRSVRAAQRAYEYRLAEVMARAQEAGVVVEGDPHVLAMLLIGSIGRTARWYSSAGRVPEPEFRALLKAFVFNGLVRKSATDDSGSP